MPQVSGPLNAAVVQRAMLCVGAERGFGSHVIDVVVPGDQVCNDQAAWSARSDAASAYFGNALSAARNGNWC